MYNLSEYAFLVGDRQRMRAYADAIARMVRPGDVVVDLGAGAGVLAILAAKAGARRVYAIEAVPLGSVVAHAAASSGAGDQVRFVHGTSTSVALPERADLIVSDLHGVLPFYRQHLPSILDARARFLRPGGALIPAREWLRAALVQAPRLFRQRIGVFDGAPYGVNMDAIREMLVNRWYAAQTKDIEAAGEIATIAALDYAQLAGENLDTTFELVSPTDMTAHGFSVWFDGELAPGVCLSNSPAHGETVFCRAFFPFHHPVPLRGGGSVQVRLRAKLEGADYVWCWDTDGRGGDAAVRFRQSTFFGYAIR